MRQCCINEHSIQKTTFNHIFSVLVFLDAIASQEVTYVCRLHLFVTHFKTIELFECF